MRMGPFYLVFLFAIGFANSGVAQPAPLLGNVNVMPGPGANFSTIVPILTGAPLRFWTDNSSGLPSGGSITPTYIEPGANRLTLHVEASPNAPLIANKLVDLYAGGSLSAAYRISVSVIAPSPVPCSLPSLRPMDRSTQAVLLSNLTPGCSVQVWAGDGNGLAPVAVSLAGASVSRVPLPRHLDPGAVVRVLQVSGTVTTTFTDPLIVQNNYVTNRYDNERSGWNPNESTLTVNTARGLAKICEHMVDGPIRAQPLFVQDVDIPGKGKHNVVFVATDADPVWAFDADSCVPSHKGLGGGHSR